MSFKPGKVLIKTSRKDGEAKDGQGETLFSCGKMLEFRAAGSRAASRGPSGTLSACKLPILFPQRHNNNIYSQNVTKSLLGVTSSL